MTTQRMNIRPLQRLSYSEKVADKNKWGKQCVEYFISTSLFGRLSNPVDRDVQMFYDLYNNKFPDRWFNYVKNPLSSTKNEYKNFPARIRPYSIIRPNIDLFCGEYSKRPYNYRVINAGADAHNSFEEQKKATLTQNINQHFINAANEAGANTGQETEQIPTPQQILDKLLSSYKDILAIQGQDALRIIEEEESLREKFFDLMKDWCIAGETYTYKGISFSEIDYDRVSPLDIDYDKSPHVKYIEDGDWVTRRMRLTISDVVDRWYEELKEEDFDKMEAETGSNSSWHRTPQSYLDRFSSYNRDEARPKIEVIHCVWKSKRKLGILSYIDPLTGEIQSIEVDENYVVDKEKGETIEWIWGNEVWEGYRIDEDIYLGIGPIETQRSEMNNFSKCKLPYNGKRFSDTHSENVSPLEMGIPYQIMHIIYKYRLELTIAKHKGKLALIDKNVIPNKPGWDEEKFLYYAESMGYAFVDRNQIGADKSFNQYQVLDMDFFQHIEQMLKLIDANKREWDEVLGINPYRKGQTQASDAVGNVQQGIFQSSIISETIYKGFEDFVKRELTGLLDISKFAWIDGRIKSWRSDDMRDEILKIDPEKHINANYDLFVTDSSSENENLKALKSNTQAFAQNKVKPSTIAEILQANNFAKVTNTLKKVEAMEQQLEQAMAKDAQDAEERRLQITNEFEALKHSFDVDLQEKKYDRENELAEVKGNYQIESAAVVKGGAEQGKRAMEDVNLLEDRILDREKHGSEIALKNKELNIKEKEIKDKDNQVDKKLEVERYKADKTLEVAKENKSTNEKK